MSTITTLNDGITGASFRSQVNTNFSNLNTDKAEKSGGTFTGDISVPDEAYGAGWNGSLEVPTKNAIYDKIETMGGGGSSTFIGLTDTPSSYSGQTGKFPKVNAGETGLEFVTITGGGDALTSNPLSQFASTTSAQLAGVISDETGSGSLVFGTDPTFTTRINTPEIKATSSAGVDVHNNSGTQIAIFGAGGSTGSTLVGTTNVGSASADYHQLAGGTGTITDTATGSSSNININLVPKGTGRVQANGTNLPINSTSDVHTIGSIELGHATDTTLTRVSAGVVSIEGNNIVTNTSSPTLGTITTTGNIELGNASDTTISRESAGQIAVEGIRARLKNPLVVSATSYTTDTGTSLNMDNLDIFVITAQAGALLFNAPGGTLAQGRQLIIRIKDNGTARALTWNSVFRAMGTALPSTTVLSKTLYLGFIYNSTDTKWDLVASAQEA